MRDGTGMMCGMVEEVGLELVDGDGIFWTRRESFRRKKTKRKLQDLRCDCATSFMVPSLIPCQSLANPFGGVT